ncbi:MAG: putative signal transduction histidine kinase [Actinomycetia bacterium]|nr:putative signal transduction histidine kinase [Actinomycetes bacterium]
MPQHAGIAQLKRLLDAIMLVGTDLDLPDVLERIVTVARDLVDARYAALGVLDRDRTGLDQFITVGLTPEERARMGELPKGHGILGLLIVDPKPLRLPDLTAHPDSFGFPPGHPPMQSFLGVPLYVRGVVFGNLYLTDKQDGAGFSDIDEEMAMKLASAAAIAIDNARLHERTRELSVLNDRERIAHDLHDTVIQRLVGSGLVLQGTIRMVDRPEVADRIERVIDELDETVRHLRSAIFELDTHRAPGRSLRLEVVELAAEAGRGMGFDPIVRLDGPIDAAVPDEVAGHLLAVVREALSNVARHAGASRAEVRLDVDADLVLEVHDDGCGLPAGGAVAGSGLRNLASRAEGLGGRMDVTRASNGSGTVVRWQVPLSR